MAARQGAALRVFRHRDYAHLQELLESGDGDKSGSAAARTLVVTDGVFSMDGDVADVQVR